MNEQNELDTEKMRGALKEYLNGLTNSESVHFSIDRLEVVRTEQGVELPAAEFVDVYYKMQAGEKNMPGFYRMEYDEFRNKTGGFDRLFESIIGELTR